MIPNTKVKHKNYKDYLEIVKQISDKEYLCYSPKLRHSVVLPLKELKKV